MKIKRFDKLFLFISPRIGLKRLANKMGIKYLYKNKKLKKVLSPYTKTCSSLLKKEAKERIVYMDNLKKKLSYKKKNTA